ncbi:carboxypeptidase-like regulatory domain-containing protein [Pontibacter sp. HSC-14F20]|uniref:carboxypeptidase-like regulatory domain-containing protein n=1 Tax=Pontibacter sp. HSC-14F20 TaxID=2864136 RepID=UPI001C734588|nr:carboxypeptidase-like regulatory domain-containing protein [Pontibacter sp. HSC-14F20]MBX0334457.1 carboxypeptidase-like regulatory domain-containing protein [Pontibacter sp. HSC-14F20]
MKTINYPVLLLSLLIMFSSCEKEDIDIFIIEGQIRDDLSNQPIEGVHISVDAIKSPSGMGIITDGKRKRVGEATTDKNGYYKARLKVFQEAQLLEISINENNKKEGYTDGYIDASLSTLNKGGSTNFSHTLSPTATLKIKFVNASPQTDADKFMLNWCNCGQGLTKGIIKRESCGTVQESEGGQWIGKNVCGVYTIEAVAGRKSDFSWYVTKNNETKLYLDSVFVERSVLNEFLINY